ncbi:hypothetical protein FQZ97_1027120 [compost metagenome]
MGLSLSQRRGWRPLHRQPARSGLYAFHAPARTKGRCHRPRPPSHPGITWRRSSCRRGCGTRAPQLCKLLCFSWRRRACHRWLRLLRTHPRRHGTYWRWLSLRCGGWRVPFRHGVHRQIHTCPLWFLAEQRVTFPLGDLLPRDRRGAAGCLRRASDERYRRRREASGGGASVRSGLCADRSCRTRDARLAASRPAELFSALRSHGD